MNFQDFLYPDTMCFRSSIFNKDSIGFLSKWFFFIILQEILIYSPRFFVCSLRVIFWQKDTYSPRSQGQLNNIILQEYYKVSLRVIIVL
jgi:hypothetical protein